MKDCVRYAPMLSARAGELAGDEARGLEAHLATCAQCTARLADDRALSALVGPAVMAAAARRDFSGFADAVMARVEKKRRPFMSRWRPIAIWAPALAAAAAILLYLRPVHEAKEA